MKNAGQPDQQEYPSILYIVPSAGIGGAETFIKHIAQFSSRSSPVFALLREGELSIWLKENEEKFNYKSFISNPKPKTSQPVSLFKSMRWLHQLAKQERCQLVHSSMAYSVPFGTYVASRMGIPHAWFQHGPVSGWRDTLAGALPSDLLIGNSHFTLKMQNRFSKLKNWKNQKALTLGVNLESFSRKNILEKKDTAPLRLAMLCRPQRWKGIHVFANALRQIDIPYEAFFIGANPPEQHNSYEVELLRFIEDHDLNLRFIERLENPAKILQTMDFLVNASTTPEPFGLSVIEAMAVGVIPLLPDQGGTAEIAAETNIHYRFSDPSSLAAKIKELSQNSNIVELKNKMIELAHSQYDARQCIQQLEELHETHINKP